MGRFVDFILGRRKKPMHEHEIVGGVPLDNGLSIIVRGADHSPDTSDGPIFMRAYGAFLKILNDPLPTPEFTENTDAREPARKFAKLHGIDKTLVQPDGTIFLGPILGEAMFGARDIGGLIEGLEHHGVKTPEGLDNKIWDVISADMQKQREAGKEHFAPLNKKRDSGGRGV